MEGHEKRIADLIKKLAPRKRPDALFHYTSGSGLLNIIGSRCFWATNIRYLNDTKEFALALDLAAEVIELEISSARTKFERGLLEALRQSLEQIAGDDVFVTSFSEHSDQLGKWRGYCPSGNGYSVGVSTKLLVRAGVDLRRRFLVPCVYEDARQRKLVRGVIEQALALGMELYRGDRSADRSYREAFKLFDKSFPLLAAVIKHHTFSQEDEWRLVALSASFPADAPEFRVGRSMLVPFYRHIVDDGSGRTPFSKIVVGPTPNLDLAQRSVAELLRTTNIGGVIVCASDIPYRDW